MTRGRCTWHIHAYWAVQRRARDRARIAARVAAETPEMRAERLEKMGARVRQWYADPVNREKKIAYNHARYEANRDKFLEQRRANRAANQEKENARAVAHYRANRDRIRVQVNARKKERLKAEPEYRDKHNAEARARHHRHRERINAHKRAYRAAHLAKVKAQEAENNRRQWLRVSAAREFLKSQGIDVRDAIAARAYLREAGLLPNDGDLPNG